MSDGIVIALISAAVSILTVLLSARDTQNKTQQMLEKNQAITSNEISHIKAEMSEMKTEIKEHNGYARSMPVIEERLTALAQRVERMEGNG